MAKFSYSKQKLFSDYWLRTNTIIVGILQVKYILETKKLPIACNRKLIVL